MAAKPPSSKVPLPAGWKESFDQKHQRWYFYNPTTKETQWNHPGVIVEKKSVWVEKFDERYNRPFWYNRKTKQSSWTRPTDENLAIEQSTTAIAPTKRKLSGDAFDSELEPSTKVVPLPTGETISPAPLSSTKQQDALFDASSPMTSMQQRKSSESTSESVASPLTSRPTRLDERRRLALKAFALSQASSSDEKFSVDSESVSSKSAAAVSSPISMPPKSPHRRNGLRVLEQTHAASSFNTDRDRAFKDGGLFGKQKLASMQRSSAEDIKLSSDPDKRRHYSSKVPSNESLLEPTSPLEAPEVRLPVGAQVPEHHENDADSSVAITAVDKPARSSIRSGAFSSILNPSGNKKPVILTSRPAFSTLHQRRMGGSKSPQTTTHTTQGEDVSSHPGDSTDAPDMLPVDSESYNQDDSHEQFQESEAREDTLAEPINPTALGSQSDNVTKEDELPRHMPDSDIDEEMAAHVENDDEVGNIDSAGEKTFDSSDAPELPEHYSDEYEANREPAQVLTDGHLLDTTQNDDERDEADCKTDGDLSVDGQRNAEQTDARSSIDKNGIEANETEAVERDSSESAGTYGNESDWTHVQEPVLASSPTALVSVYNQQDDLVHVAEPLSSPSFNPFEHIADDAQLPNEGQEAEFVKGIEDANDPYEVRETIEGSLTSFEDQRVEIQQMTMLESVSSVQEVVVVETLLQQRINDGNEEDGEGKEEIAAVEKTHEIEQAEHSMSYNPFDAISEDHMEGSTVPIQVLMASDQASETGNEEEVSIMAAPAPPDSNFHDRRESVSVDQILMRQKSLKERMELLSQRSKSHMNLQKSTSNRSLSRTSSARALETTSGDIMPNEDELPRKRTPSRTSSYLDVMDDQRLESVQPSGFTSAEHPEKFITGAVDKAETTRPAPFSKGGSVKDMVAMLTAASASSGSLPIKFGVPPKQSSGTFASERNQLNPISEDQTNPFQSVSLDVVQEGVAGDSSETVELSELESGSVPGSLEHIDQPATGGISRGAGSQRFSLPELSSISENNLLNEAHLTRAAIPIGVRRQPSRRLSTFSEE